MKYAVIQLAGKQYKVTEGDELEINSLEEKEDAEIKISDVLLVADGSALTVGSPLIKDAVVTVKVLSHHKGEKIRVAKYKAKSRYRKVHGHKQHLTTVKVLSIG